MWRLYVLEKPKKYGMYKVRLVNDDDLLEPPVEINANFKNGYWDLPEQYKNLRVWAYEIDENTSNNSTRSVQNIE